MKPLTYPHLKSTLEVISFLSTLYKIVLNAPLASVDTALKAAFLFGVCS